MTISPFVTILMPIFNEVSYIQRSFFAILSQDYPAIFKEVLVIDGLSTDGTREAVVHLAAKYPQISFRLLDNPTKIVPTALNIGLSYAIGDVIIRVDGHTIIASDYVSKCVDILMKTSADNVGGRMNAVGENGFGKVVALATSSPFGVGGARFHYSDAEEWVDTVYMGAWPRSVFEKIGLFDEELVRDQDDEFNYRLLENGGKILLCPKIKSSYMVRSSPLALWRQYYQYGFWKVRVFQKHPRQMRQRQFVPPAFVFSLLTSLLLALFIPLGRWVFVLITGVYLLANLTASGWEASRRGWRYLPVLPVVFSILHLSYGLGFLVGLVRFAHRWGDKLGKTPSFSNDHV